MAQRGIREYDGKRLMKKYLKDYTGIPYEGNLVLVGPETNLEKLPDEHPWLLEKKLVVKPDQLFGKRGKHGLVLLNADFEGAKQFIQERRGKEVTVGRTTGILTHFLIEEFVPHDQKDEHYIAIRTFREHDSIYFSTEGGVDIEANWDKVIEIQVPVLEPEKMDIEARLPESLGEDRAGLAKFIKGLYDFFVDLHFTYLEINPFVIKNGKVIPLDLVARLDDTAAFEVGRKWGDIEFPPAFGMKLSPEEEYIKSLDEKSGASLKLTILNPDGRVWTMVAGGGASVIYADTIVDLGYGKELANYGEYSGNPTTDETYEYAKTILDLMTRKKEAGGKVLIIGGGIANFTDVAKTFTGIIQALKEYRDRLIENRVRIYVRRGGPNYQEGLRQMRELGETLGVPIEVYGPETHMTAVVPMALEALKKEVD